MELMLVTRRQYTNIQYSAVICCRTPLDYQKLDISRGNSGDRAFQMYFMLLDNVGRPSEQAWLTLLLLKQYRNAAATTSLQCCVLISAMSERHRQILLQHCCRSNGLSRRADQSSRSW